MLPDTEAVTDTVLPLMVSHNNRVLPSASLWYIKVLPFSDSYQTPRIKGQFCGTLIYEYNGTPGEKNVTVFISQTLLSNKIKFSTNETSSVSVTSKILCENGDSFLYYTYITQPQSKARDYNPAQYGACRLEITSSDKLTGFYWTSSRTRGDFSLCRKV